MTFVYSFIFEAIYFITYVFFTIAKAKNRKSIILTNLPILALKDCPLNATKNV